MILKIFEIFSDKNIYSPLVVGSEGKQPIFTED